MKESQRHNIFIFLLVMAFFTGATIQFSEGSVFIGVVLFLIALALTTKIRLSGEYITKNSKFFIIIGVFIPDMRRIALLVIVAMVVAYAANLIRVAVLYYIVSYTDTLLGMFLFQVGLVSKPNIYSPE